MVSENQTDSSSIKQIGSCYSSTHHNLSKAARKLLKTYSGCNLYNDVCNLFYRQAYESMMKASITSQITPKIIYGDESRITRMSKRKKKMKETSGPIDKYTAKKSLTKY